MTKHAFPAYAFHKQNRYLRRHLVKPMSIKLCSFISRIQKSNAYLSEFLPDIEGQEIVHLPADEIIDIIYHSIPSMWKNKMIEQGFNYADSAIIEKTYLFETRIENLEPKEEKKKSTATFKK